LKRKNVRKIRKKR